MNTNKIDKYQRIELFGYPGCGKTTVMKAIAQNHEGFVVEQANFLLNFRNALSFIGFIVRYPRLLLNFRLLKYIPLAMTFMYAKTVLRFILRVMVLQRDLKAHRQVLVDEGLLQITWSLLLLPAAYNAKFNMAEKAESIVKKYWPTMPLLIYHIKVADEEYIRRVKSRERRHFFSTGFINNQDSLREKGSQITAVLLAKAQKKYTVKPYQNLQFA